MVEESRRERGAPAVTWQEALFQTLFASPHRSCMTYLLGIQLYHFMGNFNHGLFMHQTNRPLALKRP